MAWCRMILAMTLVPCGMLFALSTWFLTNAVADGMEQATGISSVTVLQLTNAVQAGFILATVGSAATGLADRYPAHLIFGISAVCAGSINALVLVDGLSLGSLAVIRLLTGAFLAGVYPIGMKLLFSAAPKNRGLALGLAVGALTMGSGLPHLLAANFAGNWRAVVATSSALSVGAGFGIAVVVSLAGGELGKAPSMDQVAQATANTNAAASGTSGSDEGEDCAPAKDTPCLIIADLASEEAGAVVKAGSGMDLAPVQSTVDRSGCQTAILSTSSAADTIASDAIPVAVRYAESPPVVSSTAGIGLTIRVPQHTEGCLSEDGGGASSARHTAPAATAPLSSVLLLWTHVPSRLAFIGYLGHVAELYAAWTVFAPFLRERFTAELDPSDAGAVSRAHTMASVVTFCAFAAGAVLCPVAGFVADYWLGRSLTTTILMMMSGSTALWLGFATNTSLVACGVVFYGATIVPDSAQFSTAIGELAPPEQRGAMLSASTGVGFLVTMITIATTTAIQQAAGWGVAFALLAIGPAIGAASMMMLRAQPEAIVMANGRR